MKIYIFQRQPLIISMPFPVLFFQYAVVIDVPKGIRIQRVKNRSFQKFGKRMLSGGDLYEQEEHFFDFVKSNNGNPQPADPSSAFRDCRVHQDQHRQSRTNFISIDPNGHFELLLCSLQFFSPASPTTLILSAGQWFPPNNAF